MDSGTLGPSMDTCKANPSDRLTHLHVHPRRILKTHISPHPRHKQDGEDSPSRVSSDPTKRNPPVQPRPSYHTMMVP
jgi:hypothetical protein